MKITHIVLLIITLLTPSFGGDYNRIVSLGPSVSAQISLLEENDRLVGRTNYCSDSYSTCDKVGSLLELNVEKIITLNPDLILAVGLTPKPTIEKLRSFGIPIKTIDDPLSFNDLAQNLRTVASYCDADELADSIITKAYHDLELLEQTQPAIKESAILQIGANPIFITIDGKITSELLKRAGVINPFAEYQNAITTREEVITVNPDNILITEMGISGELEIAEWKKFSSLSAVKNSKMFIVDTQIVCSPTVPDFVTAVQLFRTLIYGESSNDM